MFRSTKSAVKLHTLLDLRGNIPTFIHISDGTLHDVNVLDILFPEPGAFYIMDRGYVDFKRLFTLHTAGAFFVIRAKSNTQYQRRYSHPVDPSTALRCDQTIVLNGIHTAIDYPHSLRRIKYYDAKSGKTFNFLTNNFAVPAQTVADLYRYRWQVELFLQVDQAASADQILFRHLRECCKDPDLDRHLRLRTHRYHQKEPWNSGRSLHNPTDFEPDPVRKILVATNAYPARLQNRDRQYA